MSPNNASDETYLVGLLRQYGAVTHNGMFHADDVFSAILLRAIVPDLKISRMMSVPRDFKGVAFDIGLGRYDHHQEDAKVRPGGIKYAAFGLLWADLYQRFMPKKNFELFDKAFISEIDRCDNTPDTNLLSASVASFNPAWNENANQDEQFETAVKVFTPAIMALTEHFSKFNRLPRASDCIEEYVDLAIQRLVQVKSSTGKLADIFSEEEDLENFEKSFLCQFFKTYGVYNTSPMRMVLSVMRKKPAVELIYKCAERKCEYIKSLPEANTIAEKAYREFDDDRILVLPKYVPFGAVSERHPQLLAVVFPSERGGWSINMANMSYDEKIEHGISPKKPVKRMDIPEKLCGKKEEDLRSLFPGLFFVHPSGSVASCDTKEQAIEFAKSLADGKFG